MSLSDEFGSQYLSASQQNLSSRRSKTSLHGESGGGAARGASLAHELAAALMPEPSAGSRLLADEFGLEFDEGAEGIDEGPEEPHRDDSTVIAEDDDPRQLVNGDSRPLDTAPHPELDTTRQDPLASLNQDLETTEAFIQGLRRLDNETTSGSIASTSTAEPPLERFASDVIRRLNDTVREREGQVRELRECDKEFRRIAEQVGGTELLGELSMLESVDDLREDTKEKESSRSLPSVVEEEEQPTRHHTRQNSSVDWELAPDRVLGDDGGEDTGDYDEQYMSDSLSPIKEGTPAPPPPPLPNIPTPGGSITQLAYMRTVTQSLVQSLTTIVEHTQVNGAAVTEAGRKIRALKNKIGGWRSELEGVERSMEKIDKWESSGGIAVLLSPGLSNGAPNKGQKLKQVMQEELSAFELVLADAGRKAQAIMAAS